MKVKKNDTVYVMTGKDAGKTGKVLSAFPTENKIKVDGVNVQKRHQKARSAQQPGGIVEQVGAIDASNVLVVCPACGKGVRVRYSTEGEKKQRVCAKCGASLDVKKEAKATKTAAKKTTAKKTTAKKATKKKDAE